MTPTKTLHLARVGVYSSASVLPLFLLLLFGTACRPTAPSATAPILLFNGSGTSPNDVKAIEAILKERRLDYSTVNSDQLNGMSESQLAGHRLLIVPGGNYLTMGDGISSQAATNVHNAVGGGLNYLGICTGGLLAGNGAHQILNLSGGVRFDFYAVVNQGVHKAAVLIAVVDGPVREHYWEDGPQLTGWGAVVAKYPDGSPAVAEGACGKGWVILCGIHPEAPENWRGGMRFKTPASEDNAYAGELIEAALNGKSLSHF